MVATMAKEQQPKGRDDALTTVKIRRRVAQKLSQLAALSDRSIPDVLDGYEKTIDEDLLRQLARRKAEIEQPRPK